MKMNKVCTHCGSTYVMHDAWASWDVENQKWVLDNVYDTAFCGKCDGETLIVDVPEDQVIDCAECGDGFHNKYMNETSRGDYLCEECNKKEDE